jgi:hypothetical protein
MLHWGTRDQPATRSLRQRGGIAPPPAWAQRTRSPHGATADASNDGEPSNPITSMPLRDATSALDTVNTTAARVEDMVEGEQVSGIDKVVSMGSEQLPPIRFSMLRSR